MSVVDRFDRLLDLLDREHAAEIEQNKLELSRFPPAVREALGKTVTKLNASDEGLGEGGFALMKLSRQPAGEELSPFHAMNRGDLVSAESPTGQRLDGTLYDVDEYEVVVALNAAFPEGAARGRWSIHLVGSDATYKRMRRAVQDVQLAEKKMVARLRDVFFAKKKTSLLKDEPVEFLNRALNEYQQDAVRTALAAEDAAVIHGPPGTGKTTVLVEIILQAVARGHKVLATAPSNIAVDNMVEKLLPSQVKLVRLGHPARTLEALRHSTLASQIAEHPDANRLRDLHASRERLAVQKSRRAERGQLGYDERHERQREIQALWREARDMEREIKRQIMQGAQVVLCTHGSISKPLIGRPFDLVVLDEASQAMEPLSWIPLLQAKKAVFAGDPLQLPPTLYSKEAAKRGLEITLLEHLMEALPKDLQTLLRIQYRMNQRIMEFSSREFYGGKLIAHESVRDHLICGLPRLKKTDLTSAAVVYIDTAGAGFEESWDETLQSRENAEEAALTAKLLDRLLADGLPSRAAAILTPYVAQVKRFKATVKTEGVEIGTVDGFQGREKEAILISLVRSNDKGEVGFLEDTRRLNVALTRARRLLIVIGDSATIAQHPVYARFIEHAEARGLRLSAWDFA